MIGVILGIACGGIEFYLLRLLIDKTLSGHIPIWIPPVKLFVLALFLIPCGLIAPSQLYLAGIGIAAVLVVGSITKFVIHMVKERQNKLAGLMNVGDEAK